MKALTERLAKIQGTLNAPKSQYNSFGKYSYRNCEDILQALKPLLDGLVLTITDDIHVAADRVYVKATVTITDGEHSISNQAYAREPVSKKGSDESQITGAASSYARKYALNGLLLIDDNKDADSQDNREAHKEQEPKQEAKPFNIDGAVKAIRSAGDMDTVNKYVNAARTKGASELQMQSIQNEATQRIEQIGEPA